MRILPVLLLLSAVGLGKPDRFYRGPVRIRSLAAAVDLTDAADTVAFKVRARNDSPADVAVPIAFRDLPLAPRRFTGGEEAALDLRSRLRRTRPSAPGGAERVRIDTRLEIDGRAPLEPVEEVEILVELPPGVEGFIRTSVPLEFVDRQNGRKRYRLRRRRAHLRELDLVYTTGPVTLQIEKSLPPTGLSRPGMATITLEVKNLGPGVARDVVLEDNFDPFHFAAQGAAFTSRRGGKGNDARLLWKATIPRLDRGQKTTVTLQLRVRRPFQGRHLAATRATIDGKLVGVSNTILLK